MKDKLKPNPTNCQLGKINVTQETGEKIKRIAKINKTSNLKVARYILENSIDKYTKR